MKENRCETKLKSSYEHFKENQKETSFKFLKNSANKCVSEIQRPPQELKLNAMTLFAFQVSYFLRSNPD